MVEAVIQRPDLVVQVTLHAGRRNHLDSASAHATQVWLLAAGKMQVSEQRFPVGFADENDVEHAIARVDPVGVDFQ